MPRNRSRNTGRYGIGPGPFSYRRNYGGDGIFLCLVIFFAITFPIEFLGTIVACGVIALLATYFPKVALSISNFTLSILSIPFIAAYSLTKTALYASFFLATVAFYCVRGAVYVALGIVDITLKLLHIGFNKLSYHTRIFFGEKPIDVEQKFVPNAKHDEIQLNDHNAQSANKAQIQNNDINKGVSAAKVSQDVLRMIFAKLDPESIANASAVCKDWQRAQQHKGFWYNEYVYQTGSNEKLDGTKDFKYYRDLANPQPVYFLGPRVLYARDFPFYIRGQYSYTQNDLMSTFNGGTHAWIQQNHPTMFQTKKNAEQGRNKDGWPQGDFSKYGGSHQEGFSRLMTHRRQPIYKALVPDHKLRAEGEVSAQEKLAQLKPGDILKVTPVKLG